MCMWKKVTQHFSVSLDSENKIVFVCQWCFSCVRSWKLCSCLVCRTVSESLMILDWELEPCWWETTTHKHAVSGKTNNMWPQHWSQNSISIMPCIYKVKMKFCLCWCRLNSVKWWRLRRSRCGCSSNGQTPPLCLKTPSASSSKTAMTSDRICLSCRWALE